MEAVPDGAALVLLAVDELDLDLAGEQRGLLRQALRVGRGALLVACVPVGVVGGIGGVGPGGLVGQPAVGDQSGQGVLDEAAGGRDLGRFALPLADLGIPPGQALVVLVPHHEAVNRAAFLDVGLGDELRAHVDAAVAFPAARRGQPRFIVAVQESGVRPAAHHRVVVGLVLDDPVDHAERQRAVGGGAQIQPAVGFLGNGRHARVDDDVVVGVRAHVGDGAVGGVVVGVLDRGAPLQVHLRLRLDFHPRRAHLVGHDAGPVTRALAHLVGQMRVRRAEELLHALVGAERPHAGGAAHDDDGLSAVLVDAFAETLADELERLVERDAHPAGVGHALRVRALDRVAQTIGMVGGLHGRLRLRAAMATGLRGALVALDLDGFAVLDGDPHAAFDFAAGAAAGADVLDLARGRGGRLGKGLHGSGHRSADGACGAASRGGSDEAAT